MRIRKTESSAARGAQQPAARTARSGLSLFSREITRQEKLSDSHRSELEILSQEIDELAGIVTREPTIPNFTRFRESLGRLTSRITQEAYRLERIGGTPQNPRYYEIISVINQESDRLYHEILQRRKDTLAITAQVVGIKGLVIDLMT